MSGDGLHSVGIESRTLPCPSWKPEEFHFVFVLVSEPEVCELAAPVRHSPAGGCGGLGWCGERGDSHRQYIYSYHTTLLLVWSWVAVADDCRNRVCLYHTYLVASRTSYWSTTDRIVKIVSFCFYIRLILSFREPLTISRMVELEPHLVSYVPTIFIINQLYLIYILPCFKDLKYYLFFYFPIEEN